jgi:hypothetical protein
MEKLHTSPMLRKEQQMMDDVTCYQDIPTEKEYIEVL